MDDPALIEAQPIRHIGALELVRWRDPGLPTGLTDLHEEALRAGYAWMGDFGRDWTARPFLSEGEALFLALHHSRPVAMAAISADPHAADADTGRLRYIYVGAEARRRGLLRIFVEASLARAGRRWRRLRLHTDNPVAARVYESYGFRLAPHESRSTHVREDYRPAEAVTPSGEAP